MVIDRIKAFGMFWWTFLVGDAWELAVGGLLVLAIAYALRHTTEAAFFVVPMSVVAILGGSTWFGRHR